MVIRRIVESKNLEPVPAIGNAAVLTPSSHASLLAAIQANPDKDTFLCTPGNYSAAGWGSTVVNNISGLANSRRSIRFYDPTNPANNLLHPCRRTHRAEAVFDGISFTNGSGWWHVYGLTQRHSVGENQTLTNAHHITYDWMLIERSTRPYGARFRSSGGYQTLQRSVFRDSLGPASSIGLNIDPTAGAIDNTKVLDNEIYNYGDCLQAGQNSGNMYVATSGLVEGNCMYINSERHTFGGLRSTAEDGVDMKSGSDTDPWIFRTNRLWGFRENGTDAVGAAFVFHNGGRNAIIYDNVVGECPKGLHQTRWDAGDLPPGGLGQNTPHNIVVRANQFHDILQYANLFEDSGAVLRLISNDLVEDNWFRNCHSLLFQAANDAGGPTLRRNLRPENIQIWHPGTTLRSASYAEGAGAEHNRVRPPTYYDAYERKRWTGIEIAFGAKPIDHANDEIAYSSRLAGMQRNTL